MKMTSLLKVSISCEIDNVVYEHQDTKKHSLAYTWIMCDGRSFGPGYTIFFTSSLTTGFIVVVLNNLMVAIIEADCSMA
jgi:hypothetical protein